MRHLGKGSRVPSKEQIKLWKEEEEEKQLGTRWSNEPEYDWW